MAQIRHTAETGCTLADYGPPRHAGDLHGERVALLRATRYASRVVSPQPRAGGEQALESRNQRGVSVRDHDERPTLLTKEGAVSEPTLQDAIIVVQHRQTAVLGGEAVIGVLDEDLMRRSLLGTDLPVEEVDRAMQSVALLMRMAITLGITDPLNAIAGAWADGLLVGLALAKLREQERDSAMACFAVNGDTLLGPFAAIVYAHGREHCKNVLSVKLQTMGRRHDPRDKDNWTVEPLGLATGPREPVAKVML